MNIHEKNSNQIYKKFPFVYNLNTISNSPKNLLTINIDDSYIKHIIKGRVFNINNHNFLTSNNVRSQKNIRNIIVNNISPTVNVLIHSEGRHLMKSKKQKEQKRINSNLKLNFIPEEMNSSYMESIKSKGSKYRIKNE